MKKKDALNLIQRFVDDYESEKATHIHTLYRIKKALEKVNNIKDNPVASLDNKDIKLIIETLRFRGDLYAKSLDSSRAHPYYSLISKLQNAVETNKEQPKKSKCNICGLRVTDTGKHWH